MLKNIKNRPFKMWIDGRVYNIKPPKVRNKHGHTIIDTSIEAKPSEIQIIKENDKYIAKFFLPNAYNRKLDSNFNSNDVATKTETQILIERGPKCDIKIEGENEANVVQASNELIDAIGQTRRQIKPNYFISIPLISEEILENVNKFKSEVLEIEGIENMEESIFLSSLKMHLTLSVFSIFDEELNEAKKALEEYKSKLQLLFEKYGILKIKVEGINIMNNNPKKVDVLYANAKIVHDNAEVDLQKIVGDICEHFYEKGLCKENTDSVKLHMTLINTKYRNTKPLNKKKRFEKRIPIDASQILEKFKDYQFGFCDFKTLHLSEMGSVGEDGFYKCVYKIDV